MLKSPTADQTQRHMLFHLGLLTCCITMITYFLAFVSPYWLESIPEYHSPFLRIGLWEICFDGYLHPRDYVSKAYFGCWYIYFPEFSAISDWLNPPWYLAVQMLGIAAFICILLSTVVMGSQFVRVLNRDSHRWLRANTAFHLIAGLCITIQLVAVAVQSRDQRWMPRPDQNRLGYSFGLALVAVIASVFTLGFLVVRYVSPEEDQLIWSAGDSADGPLPTSIRRLAAPQLATIRRSSSSPRQVLSRFTRSSSFQLPEAAAAGTSAAPDRMTALFKLEGGPGFYHRLNGVSKMGHC